MNYLYTLVEKILKLIRSGKSKICRGSWEIYNSVVYRNAKLICVIWPPAFELSTEIVEQMRGVCSISEIRKFQLPPKSAREFIFKLYEIDKASIQKIAPKIDRLLEAPVRICLFYAQFEDPKIIPHCDDNSWKKSRRINEAKADVRAAFKHRVPRYVYDVIIHSVEFPEQNMQVEQLVQNYGAQIHD